MRKFLKSLIISATFILIIAVPVFASNITDATHSATVAIVNTGTVASGVSTTFELDTDALIAQNYILNDFSNVCLRDGVNTDVAFMPAQSGANDWTTWVSAIGAAKTQNYKLYAGGATDMAAKLRYFPDDAGMTSPDSPTLELDDDFNIEIAGYVNSGDTGNRNVINKANAARLWLMDGNVIAGGIGTLDTNYMQATHEVGVGLTEAYQTFTPTTAVTVSSVWLPLTGTTEINDTIDFVFYATNPATHHPVAPPLLAKTIAGDELATTWTQIDFASSYTFAAGTEYILEITVASGDASNESVRWYYTADSYAGGDAWIHDGPLTTWTEYAARDLGMYIYDSDSIVLSGFGDAQVYGRYTAGEHTVNFRADSAAGLSGELYIDIDTVNLDTTDLAGAVTPDNANNYISFTNYSMPYVEYQEFYTGFALVNTQHVEWEFDTTFHDTTVHVNDATPTFRTATTDPDVTGDLRDFLPIQSASAAYSSAGTVNLITTAPPEPAGFYDDENYSSLPGAAVINAILDGGSIPRPVFWYGWVFLMSIVVGFAIYFLTRSLMAFSMAATIWVGLHIGFGVISGYIIVPFLIFCLATILKRENPSGV